MLVGTMLVGGLGVLVLSRASPLVATPLPSLSAPCVENRSDYNNKKKKTYACYCINKANNTNNNKKKKKKK